MFSYSYGAGSSSYWTSFDNCVGNVSGGYVILTVGGGSDSVVLRVGGPRNLSFPFSGVDVFSGSSIFFDTVSFIVLGTPQECSSPTPYGLSDFIVSSLSSRPFWIFELVPIDLFD